MSAPEPKPIAALARLLDVMPDPCSAPQTEKLEGELARYLAVGHAVAVSSGTAALHCALAALGIGPGDEVLVPAMSVVMSVAPVVYAGARPVFVDCDPGGTDFDYDDLEAKLSKATRCVIPVYLWGRAGNPVRLGQFAAAHGLRVVEDACQAHGTRFDGRLLGTFGDLGCFSTKDGKLLWSGEGGFIVTDDDDLVARCRAFRTHWQAPPDGEAPLSRLGHNYRLSEPQALIARWNLARFSKLLSRRRHQAGLLAALLTDLPDVRLHRPRSREEWNGYAPVALLDLPKPRDFSVHLASLGVPNSVGSFGLVPCDLRSPFACHDPAPCPRARALIDATLAVVLNEKDDDDRIHDIAAIITREVHRWVST